MSCVTMCRTPKQAGSVIAFAQYADDLHPGDRGMICSFGAGYSVGSVLVERA